MRLKRKKLLGIILSLVLALGLMPGMGLTVRAANATRVFVGNQELVSGKKYVVTGASGSQTIQESTSDSNYIQWVSSENTLTLNGVSFNGAGYDVDGVKKAAIFAEGDLTIHLVGENTVTMTGAAKVSTGVHIKNGTLTITADPNGTLTAIGDSAAGSTSMGIRADNLIIQSGTVKAIGGKSGGNSIDYNYGVYAQDGDGKVTVEENGTLYANTTDGANAENISVERYSNGILCKTFESSGTVAAFGCQSNYESVGIEFMNGSNQTATIKGGSLTAIGGECGEYGNSNGIFRGELKVESEFDSILLKGKTNVISGVQFTVPSDDKVKATVSENYDGSSPTSLDAGGTTTYSHKFFKLEYIRHTHSFTYSASGATITANCNGMGDCDITDGLTLTISAPTELTYDGNSKAATLSTGYNTTAFPDEYTIKYYQKENEIDAANVKAAGDYTAKVTVGDATASVDFTITGGGTSSGSSDNTNTNIDTSAKVPYEEVAISTGSVKDITGTAAATAESNPFGTKIENNNNLTTLLSLTDAEVAQGVNVWLDIQDMSASVPQTDKTLIQNTSGDYTVGLYLDINLFKKVGSNDATKVTETKGKVKASIVIPESLWKSGRTFEIIRVHDGVATAIAGTYDENTHVFTFETDKFSTYALAYKDPVSSSNSGTTSNSGSSNSSNSIQATAPKTGDSNDIRVWYLLLIASLGGLGFLGLSKKKEN